MIYLMRHGESAVNVKRMIKCHTLDGDLTALGAKQAHKAARWLLDKHITQIYTSPIHRAAQTAEIIGDLLGLEPISEDKLREFDCGDLEGRDDDAGWAIWSAMFDRWLAHELDAMFTGGESYKNAFERFNRVLGQLPADENVLLVTHGGMIRTIVPYLCVNAAALQVSHIANAGIILLENYDISRYICWAWNITEYLE